MDYPFCNRPRGSSMLSPLRRCRGYSLIELLVVMVIVTVLAVVGVTMIGNRPAGAVRSVMDEVEGAILGAHQLAVGTGRDVIIATKGSWSLASNPPLMLARNAGIALTPDLIIAGNIDAAGDATTSETFQVAMIKNGGVRVGFAREHMYAGIVVNGWTAAGNADITAIAPFNDASTGFNSILATAPNLFQGAVTNSARISGASKRFTSSFWVEIASFRDGNLVVGGPMGLLVVLANGATTYKFYNPGVLNGGDGTWRRL